jgi:putative transposase
MLISFACRLTRKVLGAPATVAQRDVSKDAEVLVLRHGNAVLRRRVGKVCYHAEDRLWFAALSCLIPRQPAAGKCTTVPARPGRPRTAVPVGTLVILIRMATGNRAWGRRRVRCVHGGLTRPGHAIAALTVWQVLHDAGIDPAPRRTGPTRRRFPTAQPHGILALDLVHADTVPLKRIHAPILIEHGTRRAHLLKVGANPDGQWTTQAPRHPRYIRECKGGTAGPCGAPFTLQVSGRQSRIGGPPLVPPAPDRLSQIRLARLNHVGEPQEGA